MIQSMCRVTHIDALSRVFCALSGKLKKAGCRFLPQDSGHVGVMFGIFTLPILTAVGMSVDYSSAINAKTKIQSALDASALAAGRMLQTSGSETEAKSAAQDHFDSTVDSKLNATLTVDSIDLTTGKIALSGKAVVPTTIMGIVGMPTIDVKATTEVELAMGSGDKDIEVSMMLDVTGSMSGSKLSDLKLAAKDLVQIVLQGNGLSKLKSRIALVPFSEAINAEDYMNKIADSLSGSKKFTDNNGKKKTWYLTSECATERTGSEAYSDAAPTSGQRIGRMYTDNGKCQPNAPVIPLTDNKSLLQNTIDSFYANGYTSGHLGTAWAWYTLSPNWKSIWPGSSEPAAYDPEKTSKFAILMTDGEYNTEYEDHIMTRYLKSGDSPNGSSDSQADKLCANMKAAGIIVYTVGFDLDSKTAKNTLKGCATSDEHYFIADNGDKLRETFREIAFQIAQLRISK